LADRSLPIAEDPPPALAASLTVVRVEAGVALSLPAALNGVLPGFRLDQVLICVPPDRGTEVLAVLQQRRPRSMVILPHPSPSADPVSDMELCRAWGRENDCMVLGPRSFGLQRPHLGINSSHQSKVAL